MSTYLVTGVAGFIGSHIAGALLRRGDQVRGLDDFSTGRPENLAALHAKVEFHEASILDEAAVAAACRDVDYVFHEAAIPSVPRSVEEPVETSKVNVEGTLLVLNAARKAGVKRVVYAASSSAYGDTPTLPKHEGMNPSPISPYAVAKLAGEYFMQSFFRVYGLETVALRYFNVFGPRQHPSSPYSGVFAKFITAMLSGKAPTIFGDGEQSRDFTYIDNVVEANLLACAAPASKVAGQVLNIATGKRITLNEAYSTLKELTGFSGAPIYAPERTGDIRDSLADISRAQAALGYAVKVDFKEGLRRTVEWYAADATQQKGAAS